MAIKVICDRCGAEIAPVASATYVELYKRKNDIDDKTYELCCSCAMWIQKYLDSEVSILGQGGGGNDEM